MRKAKKKSVIRVLSLLTALTLLFACAGCGNTTAQPEESNQRQEQTADKQPVEGNAVRKDTAEEKDTVPDAKDDTSEKKETSVEKTPAEKADTPKDNDTSASGTATPSVKKVVTVSISCATILDNMDLCKEEKRELVPEDGWILKPMTVTFYEGESVFNVLQRTCKQQKIHMEFSNTPIYNSAYIEGINNLYEFDVGNLSGWMYRVNDWFPNYGCSRYLLQDGDVIEWVYTCDLGDDVGGGYATGG